MLEKFNQDKLSMETTHSLNGSLNPPENPQLKSDDEQSPVTDADRKQVVKEIHNDVPDQKRTEEKKLDILRRSVLIIAFGTASLEMIVVFPLTILIVNWTSLRLLLEDNLLYIRLFVIISVIVILIMNSLLPSMACLGKTIIYVFRKLHYLLFLIAVHIVFALDFHCASSPYVAVIASWTAGNTYILLYILSMTQTVGTRGEGLYLYGLVIPVYVLVFSQPVYIVCDLSYNMFMRDVCVGVFLAMVFTYEQIFLTMHCINSVTLEELEENSEEKAGTGCKAVFAYYQPSLGDGMKKEDLESV